MELPSRSVRYQQKKKRKKIMLGIIVGAMTILSVFLLFTCNWSLGIFVVPLTIVLGNFILFDEYRKITSLNIAIVILATIISLEISYRFSMPN